MTGEPFYRSNKMTASLEYYIDRCDTFEDFEKEFSDEFLNEDARVGNYLEELLFKYDKRAAAVSRDAGRAFSYVGNIINGKKNNPSRDALICICLAMGTTFEEVQYLLKYAGRPQERPTTCTACRKTGRYVTWAGRGTSFSETPRQDTVPAWSGWIMENIWPDRKTISCEERYPEEE